MFTHRLFVFCKQLRDSSCCGKENGCFVVLIKSLIEYVRNYRCYLLDRIVL